MKPIKGLKEQFSDTLLFVYGCKQTISEMQKEI
jgi:hypothetical protein